MAEMVAIMSGFVKAAPAPHRGRSLSKTNTASLPKLPAYGKALADRQRFNNLPFLVVICVGGNVWQSAKAWNQQPDVSVLVLTPEQNPSALQWPVKGCLCIIEWGGSAADALIVGLVKCLIKSGALSVTVWPQVDYSIPPGYYDLTGHWTATRDTIRTYHQPRTELKHVA
jgi:hypothetical protein